MRSRAVTGLTRLMMVTAATGAMARVSLRGGSREVGRLATAHSSRHSPLNSLQIVKKFFQFASLKNNLVNY